MPSVQAITHWWFVPDLRAGKAIRKSSWGTARASLRLPDMDDEALVRALRKQAMKVDLDGGWDGLLAAIGDASLVLLGEATHGSDEFYAARLRISQRLIEQKGFDAIAAEADWPDALRAHRYAVGTVTGESARDSLRAFRRFPLWMWRNERIVQLLDWLRAHNAGLAPHERAGFFGLDLYSLRNSMHAVVHYLQQVDPEAAAEARQRYACFDHLADEPQRYGRSTRFGLRKDCEDEVVRQLKTMLDDAGRYLQADGEAAPDELFYAQQNARVAQNAEAYYRTMFSSIDSSWNVRDSHMADTLFALREHLGRRRGRPAKIIVWAHNSHIGDARATEMGRHGELNLGQLVRERCGPGESFLLGFTTHTGTVTAADQWDDPAQQKQVRPSLPDSHESLFHRTGLAPFLLNLRELPAYGSRLERAIGVIYRPDTERWSHYFEADMASQFDAVVHIDDTHALRPLDRGRLRGDEDMPETWPSGI